MDESKEYASTSAFLDMGVSEAFPFIHSLTHVFKKHLGPFINT